MCGEPNICIQYRLQHLQCIAAAGEMMRNYQCHESHRARARCADAVPENTFENKRNNDRTPPNENSGRIKIRHRWALLQIDA
jgi:hypothetical protein